MSKADETYYPVVITTGQDMIFKGVTQREKLAMEIYSRAVDVNVGGTGEDVLDSMAKDAIRAADIFFEQLDK